MTARDSLRRFLHLERRRPDAPSTPEADTRGRFDAIEIGPAPDRAGGPPAVAAERFRPPPESGLALDVAPEGQQPFVRCARCEADHARHAARCNRCGADLTTPEQRDFNERLWAERRRQADAEGKATDARRDAVERDARAQQALALAMADEVLRQERERRPWLLRALTRLGRFLSMDVDP
jgi:hypothetical protein